MKVAWKNQRKIDQDNLRTSNIYFAKGCLENIGTYLCPDGEVGNFIISGGVQPAERYRPLGPVLDTAISQYPLIVLHGGGNMIRDMTIQAWQHSSNGEKCPLWIVDQTYPEFEPLYGMGEMQAIMTLRQLAKKLEYTVTPRFERTVRAHFMILSELSIPLSLSGLYYLCQFDDMEEFHSNVMTLPCGENIARRIWADLGVDTEDSRSQFDLFRAVIGHLAHAASHCGWNPDNTVSQYNCLQALAQNAVMVMEVNDLYADLLLAYLAEELRGNRQPFVLLLDGLHIADSAFFEYLCLPNTGCRHGILSENVVEHLGENGDSFLRLAETTDNFVLLKHNTGKTTAILSEVFGKCDYMKAEVSHGVSHGFFQFVPRDRHDDMRYSVENRYRVMPEEITSLKAGQAILFTTATDEIIHYN